MNALYGTDQPDTPSERTSVGKLAFTLQGGALRHIAYDGVEMIRGIAFLVRDRDWGTLVPHTTELLRETGDRFNLHLRMQYQSGGAELDVAVKIAADEQRLEVSATGAVDGPFETNRAGFTLLHPASVAGCPAMVGHSDGTTDAAQFPVLIDPWQPFMDIVALEHERDGLRVRCLLSGDTFEMEDQRQWGDASFKTYNRPLALPWPYDLSADAPLEQSVHLTWEPVVTDPDPLPEPPANVTFPKTALALTAQDALRLAENPSDIAEVAPQRLLCHIDCALGDAKGQIAAFAKLQSALPVLTFDAELICNFAPSVHGELTDLNCAMVQFGFRPDSVLVCPSVDRQSTPPGSEWPDCPPLDDIHAAAAEVFQGLTRGGGMVSFFPELNRKRPPLEHLDFVSHGLCPIVHAADDVSVMETLEAIPHITRSAREIIGDRDYRIGPATIAMRQNPYGNRTIPNPNGDRLCMADDDPRHRAQFGAAYVIGLATALASAGITVWTPAAVYGPRGLSGPIVQAIAALAKCAGQPVHHAEICEGLATLRVGDHTFRANLTAQELGDLGPYEWA
ncbi:hypothetical protein HJ526_16135 [Donghicola sp. C2-DW-16]|uniref:Uncharacterized protein n=1 Tax=Donghicola mangrovi TaxID=2729614 RepID=A0ABX2PHJ1_9RHOB|nr:hypothetical protein [Donghicola mangrovi]NVO28961.1 hypothetical protein [Donghicola mangrovi]